MRPVKSTPAHQTDKFAELVCSNSLKSEGETPHRGFERRNAARGFIAVGIAKETSVPAGHALAVDREIFAAKVTEAIAAGLISRSSAKKSRRSKKTTESPSSPPGRSRRTRFVELARLTGSDHLVFYDSISPIVEADSIDMERVYIAARYDKGTADYINCPMTKEEYERFYDAVTSASGRRQGVGKARIL